ncbi:hypothetical protein FOA52_008100 [Chlamydomonas sp. UWO 241]|nr:hypothetical protein FOA52_008100 [Chlamydomonas sp. UWO 241]
MPHIPGVYDGELPERLRELFVGTGLCLTVNSDDPAYFGGYLVQNYTWLTDVLGLGVPEIAQLAKNSFAALFTIPPTVKAAMCARVDAVAVGYMA